MGLQLISKSSGKLLRINKESKQRSLARRSGETTWLPASKVRRFEWNRTGRSGLAERVGSSWKGQPRASETGQTGPGERRRPRKEQESDREASDARSRPQGASSTLGCPSTGTRSPHEINGNRRENLVSSPQRSPYARQQE